MCPRRGPRPRPKHYARYNVVWASMLEDKQGMLRKKQDVLKVSAINRNNGQRKAWAQQLEEIRANWSRSLLWRALCFQPTALTSEGCCIDQSERRFRREPDSVPDFTRAEPLQRGAHSRGIFFCWKWDVTNFFKGNMSKASAHSSSWDTVMTPSCKKHVWASNDPPRTLIPELLKDLHL